MNRLAQLYQKRLTHLFKEIGKYGRLIMNDHFSMILFVMLGFIMYFYREQLLLLKTTQSSKYVIPIVLVSSGVLSLIAGMGRPLWLMKVADKSYVYAKGSEWHAYWTKGSLLGGVLPLVINVAVAIMLLPFLNSVFAWSLWQNTIFVLMQLCVVKLIHLLYLLRIYQKVIVTNWQIQLGYFIALVVGNSLLAKWASSIILLAVAMIVIHLRHLILKQKQNWHDFEYATKIDVERNLAFYKWIGFFAEVPQQSAVVVNSRLFDKLIQWLSQRSMDRSFYLLLRLLFRNVAYRGVWLRVMIFMSLMLLITTNIYLMMGLGAIAFYITVIQILPATFYYDFHPMQNIYPDQVNSPVEAIQKVALLIQMIQWLVFSIIILLSKGITVNALLIIGIWLVVILVISYLYIPFWIQKALKERR